MTASAVRAVPIPLRGALRPAGAPQGPLPRPRLLLPPIAEPVPEVPALAAAAAALLAGPSLRVVTSPVTEAAWPVRPPLPAPRAEPLPDPARLCGSVVLAAVEALAGGRPVLQLARWVSPAVYEALSARCPAPTGTVALRRPRVRSTVVSRISARVAEASVVVHDGNRVRAAAVRVEAHRGSWRATVLQIG